MAKRSGSEKVRAKAELSELVTSSEPKPAALMPLVIKVSVWGSSGGATTLRFSKVAIPPLKLT